MTITAKTSRGEKRPQAKLTDAKVREIMASDEPLSVLASRYGTSKPAIHFVKVGKTWNHITGLPWIPKSERIR